MSVFDIIMVAILLFAAVRGYITGLVQQLGVLLGIVLGIVFSSMLAPLLVDFLSFISGGNWVAGLRTATILAFVVIFLLTYVIGHLIHKTASALKVGWLDRLCGTLFSVAKYLLIISLLLNIYTIGYEFVCDKTAPAPTGVTYAKIVRFAPLVVGYADETDIRFPE